VDVLILDCRLFRYWSSLTDFEIGLTAYVTCQQRMLTSPKHLILPSHLSGCVCLCCHTLDFVFWIVISIWRIVSFAILSFKDRVLSALEHNCALCFNLPFTGLTLIPMVQIYYTSVTEHCSFRENFVDLNFGRVSKGLYL
jgi:hypothetical protein